MRYEFDQRIPIACEVRPISSEWLRARPMLHRAIRTNFYVGIWVQSGSIRMSIDFEQVEVCAGEMLLLKPNVIQQFDASSVFTGMNVLFTEQVLAHNELAKRFLVLSPLFGSLHSYRQLRPEDASTIQTLLDLIHREQSKPATDESRDIIHSLLYALLVAGQRALGSGNGLEQMACPMRQLVHRYCAMVEEHYAQEHQVEYYTNALSITDKVLNRYCKDILGKTPKAILDHRIALEAKRLLAYTPLSTKEIAYRLGFDEPTFFVQFFKRVAGATTRAFRASTPTYRLVSDDQD